MHLHVIFPQILSCLMTGSREYKGKKRQRLNLLDGKKDHSLRPPNGLGCQGVPGKGRVCSLWGSVPSLEKWQCFSGKTCIYKASGSNASHIVMTNTSNPQPWRTLEIKQGCYPSKVSAMSAKSFQPQSGLVLPSSVGLSLSAQGRTLLLTK